MKKMIGILLFASMAFAQAFAQDDEEDALEYHEGLAAVKRNGLYGFIDKSGDVVITPGYEARNHFSEGLCAVKKDGKVGYIDKSGVVIIPFMYDGGADFHNGITRVQRDGKCGLVNKQNVEVLPIKYDYIDPPQPGFYFIRVGMLQPTKVMGLYDVRKRSPVSMEYEYIDIEKGSMVAMVQKDGKWGMINRQGKLVAPCRYDNIICKVGLCEVKVNNLYGCIDTAGKTILPPEYKYISLLEDGNGIIAKQPEGKSALFGAKGNTIIDWKYENIEEGEDGMIDATAADGTVALLDRTGKVLVPEGQYESIWYPKESRKYLMVRKGDLYGFLSADFKVTMAPVLEGVEDPDTDHEGNEAEYYGMHLVKKNGKYGLFDPERGITVVPLLYDKVGSFKEGLAAIQGDGKYGFVNRSGKEVIPKRFAIAYHFSDGVAAVTETDEGDFAFIDKEGKLLTGFRFPLLSQAFMDASRERSVSATMEILNEADNLMEFKNGKAIYNLLPEGGGDILDLEDVLSGTYR